MQEKSKKEILELGKIFSNRPIDDENLGILLNALNSIKTVFHPDAG